MPSAWSDKFCPFQWFNLDDKSLNHLFYLIFDFKWIHGNGIILKRFNIKVYNVQILSTVAKAKLQPNQMFCTSLWNVRNR